jgi:uncharacterized membrane protein YgcG
MGKTVLIELQNEKALALLLELENLSLIKVLKEPAVPALPRRSSKYLGMLTKAQSESLNEHLETIRNEWNDI